MKKSLLIALLLCTVFVSKAQNGWFFGGSAGLGYRGYFIASGEAWIGYEFNDWVAMGSGLGAVICAGRDNFFTITGIAEPFVRACVWHNESIFVDLYALGSFEFTDELKLCQVGLRPSLRFRVSENVDMAVDLVVLGAQYIPESGWRPSLSFSTMSGGLRLCYHF